MERRKIGAISSLKKGPDFSEPNAKNLRCVSGDSECRKIIETKPKKWIQRVLLWLYAPARSFRGPGESKPPDGFWFFCTGAKEQFCQSKLYAKKQLRNLWLKFLFIPLKLKTEFLHNLTSPLSHTFSLDFILL